MSEEREQTELEQKVQVAINSFNAMASEINDNSKFSALKPSGRTACKDSIDFVSNAISKISPDCLHLKWAWGLRLGQNLLGARSKLTCRTNPQSTKVSKQL